MTTIRLYNTATKAKEELRPLDPSNVRMYVCGPTVYDRAHLGNARPVVVFDVLFRLLRHVYGVDHVTYVRNFTDVDDKINAEARRRRQAGAEGSLEDLIRQRTEETIGWYHADMDALGALRPTHEPRATEFIGPMVAMIEMLIAKGHAYEVQGHVLFDVRSYAEYGKLSGRSVDDMIAGARAETAPGKRDPMDFVLWKPSDAETPGWNSPWGRGRPGWHIECSAMSHELLGPAFDIHGGGIDLQFPHHENEIAQSRCAHPDEGFAKVWMHNEMLLVEGKKMSKSLGNFFTVREEIDGGTPPEELRMAFLLSHHSDEMDLDRSRRSEAQAIAEEFSKSLGAAGTAVLADLRSIPTEDIPTIKPLSEVVDALSDDLDTRRAIGHLRKKRLLAEYSTDELVRLAPSIFASQLLLGFDLRFNPLAHDAALMADDHKSIVGKLDRRSQALANARELIKLLRERKDYRTSDQVRAAVLTAGAEVSMSGSEVRIVPTSRFDFLKLEELLEAFAPLLLGTKR